MDLFKQAAHKAGQRLSKRMEHMNESRFLSIAATSSTQGINPPTEVVEHLSNQLIDSSGYTPPNGRDFNINVTDTQPMVPLKKVSKFTNDESQVMTFASRKFSIRNVNKIRRPI